MPKMVEYKKFKKKMIFFFSIVEDFKYSVEIC